MAGELTSLSLAMGRGVVGPSGAPVLQPFVYQDESLNIFAARTGAPTNRQRASRDRAIKRIKTEAGNAWSKIVGLWLIDDAEANFLINWKSPGTKNLTKVGTPSFSANNQFTVSANTQYYDTGIPLSSLPQDGFSMGIMSKSGAAISSVEIGAFDGAGVGVSMNTRDAANKMVCRVMSTAITSVETKYYSGFGWHGITRDGPNSCYFSHNGVRTESFTTASVTPGSAGNIRIGGASGSGGFSGRPLAGAYVCNQPLTENEERILGAILRDYVDKLQYGEMDIYEPGCLPQYLSYDVVVVGGSYASVCAAVEAKRQGRSVALVMDWLATNDWDVGGMLTAGLTWIDANKMAGVTGMMDEMIRWANVTYGGGTHSRTQTGMSPPARAMQQAVRGVLTPGKTIGTIIGQDIPVFLTTGIGKIEKSGARLQRLITADGRVFSARVFDGADYEGQSVKFAGIPYITGTEAKGSGGESLNGFNPSDISLPFKSANGTGYTVSPYVVAGDPASGLLPDLITMPALANGSPDNALQSINFRFQWATSSTLYSKHPNTPPPNYNPLRYEALARVYAQNSSLTIVATSATDVLKADIGSSGNVADVNNGLGGLSTDLANSGLRYALAASDAERKAIVQDISEYMQGYVYWHLYSGDSRIPAGVKNAIQNSFWPDANTNLESGLTPVGFPGRAYIRDPIYQMKNAGFVLDGNDCKMADGTVPRSTKTGSVMTYFADRHAARTIAHDAGAGMKVYIQGTMHDTAVLGTDEIGPVPIETIMPDKTVCDNFLTPTAPSWSKIAWYIGRMEPCLAMLGQASGIIAAIACEQDIAVQDVDYTEVRNRLLATPETVKPYLPQVN